MPATSNIEEALGNLDHLENEDDTCGTIFDCDGLDSSTQQDAPQTAVRTKTLTTWSVISMCQALCNLIQHDKKRINDACVILETMIQRCNQNLDLVATFGSASDVLRPVPTTQTTELPQAMTTMVPTSRNLEQRKSSRQIFQVKCQSRRPKTDRRRLLDLYRDNDQRVHVAYAAGRDTRYLTVHLLKNLPELFFRPASGSNLVVLGELPRRGEPNCIILHRRFYIHTDRTDLQFADNICFECTILRGTLQGVEETHSRKFFSLNAVRCAVTSNQNSLVKSELSFSAENLPMSQTTIDP